MNPPEESFPLMSLRFIRSQTSDLHAPKNPDTHPWMNAFQLSPTPLTHNLLYGHQYPFAYELNQDPPTGTDFPASGSPSYVVYPVITIFATEC